MDAFTVEVSDQHAAKETVLIDVYVGVSPPSEICDDGADNDSDGLVDCDDSDDCAIDPFCCEPTSTDEIGLCADGVDNDCDGVADCFDVFDCATEPSCDVPDCSKYGDVGSCRADSACRWIKKSLRCVNR
jgi:hypothetical protein